MAKRSTPVEKRYVAICDDGERTEIPLEILEERFARIYFDLQAGKHVLLNGNVFAAKCVLSIIEMV